MKKTLSAAGVVLVVVVAVLAFGVGSSRRGSPCSS
jgi:hypothetical protein